MRCLLAAAVLATVTVIVSGESFFAFYKLSLQWPPSACSNRQKKCEKIPNTFTIHGFWPQLSDKEEVPPYDVDPQCTDSTPKTADDITPQLFGQQMLKRMDDNWPDLLRESNLGFWKKEWTKHGMCSDYPDDPKSYFSKTLELAETYNPLDQLKDEGIEPGESVYKVSKVVDAIRAKWGYNPQISCKELSQGRLLLWEIRFCVNKGDGDNPFGLQNCEHTVDRTTKKGCKSEEDDIRFPGSPLSGPEITGESLLNYADEL
ncbi:hypothetical protein PTKIN_Ptkin16aG0022200 [Pterospermum kingtungense]